MLSLIPFITLWSLYGRKRDGNETVSYNNRKSDLPGTDVHLVPVKVASWEEFLKKNE